MKRWERARPIRKNDVAPFYGHLQVRGAKQTSYATTINCIFRLVQKEGSLWSHERVSALVAPLRQPYHTPSTHVTLEVRSYPHVIYSPINTNHRSSTPLVLRA